MLKTVGQEGLTGIKPHISCSESQEGSSLGDRTGNSDSTNTRVTTPSNLPRQDFT